MHGECENADFFRMLTVSPEPSALVAVDRRCSEYTAVAKLFRRLLDDRPYVSVAHIERVVQPAVYTRCRNTVIAFHGTSRENAEVIASDGFDASQSYDGRCWFAREPSCSWLYAREHQRRLDAATKKVTMVVVELQLTDAVREYEDTYCSTTGKCAFPAYVVTLHSATKLSARDTCGCHCIVM